MSPSLNGLMRSPSSPQQGLEYPQSRQRTLSPSTRQLRSGFIDEELDYRIAQRIGSLEGWRSFSRRPWEQMPMPNPPGGGRAQVLGGKSSLPRPLRRPRMALRRTRKLQGTRSCLPRRVPLRPRFLLGRKLPPRIAAEVAEWPVHGRESWEQRGRAFGPAFRGDGGRGSYA